MNILIVEDDKYLSQKIYETFSRKAVINKVTTLHSYSEFLHTPIFDVYDVVILDIMLWIGDHKSWLKILKYIRNHNNKIPIIIMSSISEYSFLEEAFSLWAHDYVIKPFRVRELQIRVQRWFNSYVFCEPYNHQQALIYNELMYCPNKNEFYIWWENIVLSKSNKYILALLLMNRECLLSQDFLVTKIWWDIDIKKDKNLRIKIFRLKKELEKYGICEWIQNIHGEWYMLKKN